MNNDIIDRIFNVGVLPVVVIDDPSKAVLMAEALVRGNMPVAEITFRTAGAAQAIANIKHEFPDLLVGAGTVLNVDSVKAAKDAGADFALAPGVNPVVLAAAKSAGMPFFPGISSPTDIETALQAGANILKFFPAEASGGISKLATIASPYVMEKIRFIPPCRLIIKILPVIVINANNKEKSPTKNLPVDFRNNDLCKFVVHL